jgi:NAD(P)-dependent dehydrogenase (short-subunit alcohol dehydrogenase family)
MPATMAPAPSTTAALAARASAVAGSRLIARPVASAAGANRAGRGAAPARAALSVSSSATSRRARRGARVVASAAEEDERAPAQADDDDEFTVAGTARRVREAKAKAAGKKPADAADAEGISGLNPVNIGRKSRQFVDGVFKSISGLTQFTRAPSMDEGKYELYDADLLSGETLNDYANPNARFTTVLVVGANGRVGRVLVRKLLLRGYTVKALVRNQADADAMPTAVQTHVGDVSDVSVMERAVAGANKIVYCARAKTLVSGELANVDEQGVRTAVKSLQDYNNALAIRRAGRSSKTKTMLTNFVKHRDVFLDWTVDETRLVDPSDGRWQAAAEVAQRVNFGPGGEDEEGKLSKFPVFDGFVFSKTGVAQISAAIDDLGSGDARGEVALREHDGVLLRLKGDGKRYSVSLREPGVEGRTFIAPFATTGKWQIVRIPFSQFRPEVFNRVYNAGGDSTDTDAALGAPMDLNSLERVGLRFEARNQSTSRASNGWMDEINSRSQNSFGLELEYIKLLPKGDETDFILVSCGGAHLEEGEDKDKLVASKKSGEKIVRNSGLGYTVVRPGTLLEEPGGSKALVFDQGNRITMPISCADVADVCLRALHDEQARNKSFDVCYEYGNAAGAEGGYEKIAQVTGTNDNYLTPALAVLEKNT